MIWLPCSAREFTDVGDPKHSITKRGLFTNFVEATFMARVTVEDCLEKVSNRFELVILASKRAKQLFKGAKPLLETGNLEIVTAPREIAAGKVRATPAVVDVGPKRVQEKASND